VPPPFARLLRTLAALLAFLAVAGPTAVAAPAPCTGTDFLAELAATDPARHAAILKAAAATENGGAVFWRIEPKTPGRPPSWLLGTTHVSDPRVLALPPAADAALKAARIVALENTNVLDPATARAAYGEGLAHIVYTDGRTLNRVLDAPIWAAVSRAMAARGLPAWAVVGWKPWLVVFGILMYPPCELARWGAGIDFLDAAIGKGARAAGKPVVALESVIDAFSAIDAIPEAEQIALLKALALMDDRVADLQETSVVLYEAGRIDLLWATMATLLSGPGGPARFVTGVLENAAFRRNPIMLDNARPLIDEGNAFLAVGALHLVGERGLVRLLREAGYTVTAVP
jgi:uncharacterized protein YbaP (TraB family)